MKKERKNKIILRRLGHPGPSLSSRAQCTRHPAISVRLNNITSETAPVYAEKSSHRMNNRSTSRYETSVKESFFISQNVVVPTPRIELGTSRTSVLRSLQLDSCKARACFLLSQWEAEGNEDAYFLPFGLTDDGNND